MMTAVSFSDGNLNRALQVGVSNAPIYYNSSGPAEDPLEKTKKDISQSLAFPEMLNRRDNIEKCHPNTCQWILDMKEYQDWASQDCGLLWIKGKPGAGKSTLMAFLHDRLENSSDQEGIRLDFFFTARGVELQRTPLGMLRSLLNQIFVADVTVHPQILERYEQRCRQFGHGERQWEWTRVILEELLENAILSSATRQRVTVFVDALDEAGADSAQHLATYFHQLIDHATKGKLAVRICISCRHYPVVKAAGAVEIRVEDHNRGDIASYVKDALHITTEDDSDQRGGDRLVEHIKKYANGVFQWAHLVVPLVRRKIDEGESIKDIHGWLRTVPAGLQDVYVFILKHVIEVGNREHSLLLFQWVCLAERPLSVTEMRHAFAASGIRVTLPIRNMKRWSDVKGVIESDQRMRQRILTVSGGLVEVILDKYSPEQMTEFGSPKIKPVLQVVHESVNEFLKSKGLNIMRHLIGTSEPPVDAGNTRSQALLYQSCLGCLVTSIPESPSEEIVKKLIEDFPLLPYSIKNVFLHAEKAANSRAGALQDEVHILQEVITRWFLISRMLSNYNNRLLHFLMDIPSHDYPAKGTRLIHVSAAANMTDLIENLGLDAMGVMDMDEDGNTALHIAARFGQNAAGRALYKKGANPNVQNRFGRTPLAEAALYGHVEFVEWLLDDARGELGDAEKGNISALCAAAENGHQNIVGILLSIGTDPNAQSGEYGNALQAAALHGQQRIVQMLLDAHADVNAQGGQYGSALQAAAYYGDSKVVQMLLDAHADVNAQGGKYGSALQAAAYDGNSKVVQMLLDAHADVNAQGGKYGSALQAAAYDGNPKVVQMLLDAHADVNAQGGEYGNALQAGAWSGDRKIVQMLLDAHADVNAQGGEYGSALQAAAYDGNPKVVQMLLDAHADVNAQGGEYGNALQAGAWSGDRKIVQMLLDAHADVNAQGGEYGSALQAAAYDGIPKIVQMLLDAHADVNAQGGGYGNALLAAVSGKCDEDTIGTLLDFGADILHMNELGQAFLHILASKDKLFVLPQFPHMQFASAINTRDKALQTPLHTAACLGYEKTTRILLQLGASPFIPDASGRTVVDWVSGNQTLLLEISKYWPESANTPKETQKISARQSIFEISSVLLDWEFRDPWPLVRRIGQLLLFIDDSHNARYILQTYFFRGKVPSRDEVAGCFSECHLCHKLIKNPWVCKNCDQSDFCAHCVHRDVSHGKPPYDQKHEVFEVRDGPDPDGKVRVDKSLSEQLRSRLVDIIREYPERTSHDSEMEPSRDLMSSTSAAPGRTDQLLLLTKRSINTYAAVFALIAAVLAFLYF